VAWRFEIAVLWRRMGSSATRQDKQVGIGKASRPPKAPSKPNGVERDPSRALVRRVPSPLGEGCDFDFSPSPVGRGGTARRGVRGFFAGGTFKATEVCDARDFNGTLPPPRAAFFPTRRKLRLAPTQRATPCTATPGVAAISRYENFFSIPSNGFPSTSTYG